MNDNTTYHGKPSTCTTCGTDGRIAFGCQDDGPEFDNWIGETNGKQVCHHCAEQTS